jgi:hypothetical protein
MISKALMMSRVRFIGTDGAEGEEGEAVFLDCFVVPLRFTSRIDGKRFGSEFLKGFNFDAFGDYTGCYPAVKPWRMRSRLVLF